MKKVLFLTNYPSPYRVQFFDALAERMEVTVLFADRIEDKTHRSADWYVPGEGKFHSVQLTRRLAKIGNSSLCLDVIPWLKKDFDHIVICGYSNPTLILAMAWLRLHRRLFWMEVDGGLIREDSFLKYQFKRSLIRCATRWLSSGRETTRYLVHYGAKEARCFTYPFTSLHERDIAYALPTPEEKQALRRELGIAEEKTLLYVGRFDVKKGMEDLLHAAALVEPEVGVYFVGGEPSQTHMDCVREKNLSSVHFVGFQKKEALSGWYRACDVLVLPTWSDVWGLVVNEAMACGMPVITTDRCVAGMELVEPGINGDIVPVRDVEALAGSIQKCLNGDLRKMGEASLARIRPYTIENMAKVHEEIFERG